LKSKTNKLTNALKAANCKIDALEHQIKKMVTSVPTTGGDTVDKRNLNNTSMNCNTSGREDFLNLKLKELDTITNVNAK